MHRIRRVPYFTLHATSPRFGDVLHRGRGRGRRPGGRSLGPRARSRQRVRRSGRPGARRARGRRGTAVPLQPLRAQGHPARPGRDHQAGRGDGGRRRRFRRRAGRLHLPRPVHRPRPHDGPHRGRARRRRHTGTAGAGPVAAARPRLALRRRAGRPGLREVLRGRRGAPQDRRHPARRRGRQEEGPRPAPGRREAHGAHPRPAQRREPDRGPDPRRHDPAAQHRRRLAAVDAVGQALRAGSQEGDAALPVDDPARLPAAHRGPRPRRRRVHRTAASSSSPTPHRPTYRRCRSSSRWRRSGSGTA